ncbi:ATP-dependent DNA helicase RecG [bacterium]|nr:ATP-dependent DNA helicase RecG [Candidatus Elulimicrobium humile]
MNIFYTLIEDLRPKPNIRLVNALHKLGIYNLAHLLLYPPKKFINYNHFHTLSQIPNIPTSTPVVFEVTIIGKKQTRLRGRKLTIGEIIIQDQTGEFSISLFNQKLIFESLQINAHYALSAIIKQETKTPLTNISFERILPNKTLLHSHRLVPIYPETAGLSSKMLRYRIDLAIKQFNNLPETLPTWILQKANLPDINSTIRYLHYPNNASQIKKAKSRLIFEEAFIIQLYIAKQKLIFQSKYAPAISTQNNQLQEFINNLKFSLTNAQKKAIQEILDDIAKPAPMNRLLEGDVGTGKTIVATIAMLNTYYNNYQSVLMAPTEILATQHFEGITRLTENLTKPPQIALISSKESRISTDKNLDSWTSIPKKDLLKKIARGQIDIIIGTHSVITEQLQYENLALAIVDEQHRFGVKQRSELQTMISKTKDKSPDTISHLLSMTATPIPRTLALSLYGDLDVSLLNEYPANRKPIKTKLVPPSKRQEAYNFIRKHIQSGRQAFVVCPKIEADETSDLKSVEETFIDLSQNIFPELKVKMMHGKMKTTEKDAIIQAFKQKEFDILVATSVIEVGIDIPNASIMLIEGAERFGLAQLHQFRGRVGRGEYQSFCFLFETGENEITMNQRLIAIEKANNGFELAEQDLAIRGPGQFIGSNQSGLSDISMEALLNKEIILQTKNIANQVLQQDITLNSYPELKTRLSHFEDNVHFE